MTTRAKRSMDPAVFGLAMQRLGIVQNGRRGCSYEGARLVMVEGVTVARAARLCGGLRRQAVYKAMARIERAFSDLRLCARCGQRLPPV